jgi:sterol desaturase/sphingolipid hydroxylase (fatty acid hydroxylase superfamily)
MLQHWAALLSGVPIKMLGLAGWLLALGLVFGALERRWPIRPQRLLRRNLSQDIGYYFLGSLVPPFFTVLAAAVVAALPSSLALAQFIAGVGALSLGLRVVAMLVLGDLAFYWAHRWSHTVDWLWRLHVVHHSPTEMDWLVNTRAHPLDLVFARVVSALPLLVLGLRQPGGDMEAVIAITLTQTTLWAFFVHGNLRWRLGWLEQIIVTPAFHHWHHADDKPASLNKNYASLFPWIDRLFGTWHLPVDRWPTSYGADRQLPPTLVGQLLSPFVQDRRATTCRKQPKNLCNPSVHRRWKVTPCRGHDALQPLPDARSNP